MMPSSLALVTLDIAAVIILLVLASLSRRLGEALKVPPVYRIFYASAVFIGISGFLHFAGAVTFEHPLVVPSVIPMSLLLASGVLGIYGCLKYWKWLFPEFFRR